MTMNIQVKAAKNISSNKSLEPTHLSKNYFSQGQSLVEYLVVVALIAVVGIGAFRYLGHSINEAAIESVQGITNQNN